MTCQRVDFGGCGPLQPPKPTPTSTVDKHRHDSPSSRWKVKAIPRRSRPQPLGPPGRAERPPFSPRL